MSASELMNIQFEEGTVKLDKALLKTSIRRKMELGFIVMILLFPLFLYFYEHQMSIYLCNTFDSGLAMKLNAATATTGRMFPYTTAEITMSLRSSFSGLWSLMSFGLNTPRAMLPFVIRYVSLSPDKFTSGTYAGLTLAQVFAKPEGGAKILLLLYTQISDVNTFDKSIENFVCQALSTLSGAPKTCQPLPATDSCATPLAAAAATGAGSGAVTGAMAWQMAKNAGTSMEGGGWYAAGGMVLSVGLSMATAGLHCKYGY